MTSEERALAAYNEVNSLNMAVQALAQKALHHTVTVGELRDLLKRTAHAGYLAARTLDSVHRDEDRRHDDPRFPPFDGVEDAQRAMERVTSAAVAAEVRRQLVSGAQA